MQEVELISEFAILLLDGLQDKKLSVDSFYSGLDEEWGSQPVERTFQKRVRPLKYRSRDELIGMIRHVIEHIEDQATFFRQLFFLEFRLMENPCLRGPLTLKRVGSGLDGTGRRALRARRTWIAGYAALGAVGDYTVQFSHYRPIREYIAGFGITTVTLDNPT